jgi:hypothetical protein
MTNQRDAVEVTEARAMLAPHVFTHARLRTDGGRSVSEPMVPAAVALDLLASRLAAEAAMQARVAEQIIGWLETEQARLDGEDYLMDTRDCIAVIREQAALRKTDPTDRGDA